LNKEIGKRIKYYRLSKELSRNNLVDELGISIHTLAKYEQGQREPNIETLKKIATALDVSIDKLLGNEEVEKIKFKDDFDINIFDTQVIKYINDLKQKLKNTYPSVEINNTLVIQNMIINIIAKDSAKSAAGMLPTRVLNEFGIGDGELVTGQELYNTLYSTYYRKYNKERKSLLRETVSFILENRMNDEKNNLTDKEIDTLKEYYEGFSADKIPSNILAILKKNSSSREGE
jgi:transcriptional regulator with XRE-family HTH domain